VGDFLAWVPGLGGDLPTHASRRGVGVLPASDKNRAVLRPSRTAGSTSARQPAAARSAPVPATAFCAGAIVRRSSRLNSKESTLYVVSPSQFGWLVPPAGFHDQVRLPALMAASSVLALPRMRAALLITSPSFAGVHSVTWLGHVITTTGRASG
jgi:hypothetical protein